jgi:Ca-activated chloride channel family protein
MSTYVYLRGLLLLTAPLLSQYLTAPADSNGLTISTEVKLVILDVSVKDSKGGYVSGLSQDDFRAYDNGKLQTIKHFSHEDVPVTVGLVIDSSGSMRAKRPEVITAALTFIHASNPRDEAFVVNFNEAVRPGLPPETPFTGDPQMLLAALWKGKPEGRTALYDALAYSFEYLDKGRMDKKTLVVVTDGGDNCSKVQWLDVLRRSQESRATIYTIGIFDENDPDRNPGVLRKLANVSGGEYYELPILDQVVPVCKKIAADIRNRYTIAYTPPDPGPGESARRIKVTASDTSHAHLIVRTRSRYISLDRATDRKGAGR